MAFESLDFPNIERAITDFIYEEEGNISRGRMLALGTLMVVAAIMIGVQNAFAGHSSHASHASHESHVSHVSHESGSNPPPPIAPTYPPAATAPPAPTVPLPPPTATHTATPIPFPIAIHDANLRAGPGTIYPITGSVNAGQPLDVVACNADKSWFELGGGNWIIGNLTQNAQCPRVETTIPTLPPPAPTSVATQTGVSQSLPPMEVPKQPPHTPRIVD